MEQCRVSQRWAVKPALRGQVQQQGHSRRRRCHKEAALLPPHFLFFTLRSSTCSNAPRMVAGSNQGEH